MQVCVVGGLGFFGSHLVDAFLDKGHEVDVIDIDGRAGGHNWWALEGLEPPRHISWADVASSGLLWENTYDLVIDTICRSLPFGLEKPIQCYQDNINTLLTLVSIIRARPEAIKRLLYISSAEADHPSTFYGASKASCDLIIEAARGQLDLSTKIEHYKPTNMFGPRQMHRAIIPNTILSWLSGKPIVVNGSLDIRRNFVWARDIGDHIESDLTSAFPTWTASIGEILEAIRQAGLDGKQVMGQERAGDYTIEAEYPPPDDLFVSRCRELIDWYSWFRRQGLEV